MERFSLKNLKALNVWILISVLYAAFIFLFSFLYPIGGDEIFPPNYYLSSYFYSYLTVTPRVGGLLALFILSLGRWSFLILNPLVLTAQAFLIFNVIFNRRMDFKTFKDLPAFILILIFCVFAVAQPDQTLFWISGAINYSWLMTAFLFFLLILRKTYGGGELFKDSFAVRVIMFFFGIFIGMTNENLAPMAFVICALFGSIFFLQKRKLPQWFWWFAAGTVIGLALLFSAPAHHNKLNLSIRSGFVSLSLKVKLSNHLEYLDNFIKFNLFLPIITFLCLFFTGYDNPKTACKNEDFLLALFFWATAFATAFVLFAVPLPPQRAFYACSVFSILAFIFAFKYAGEIYKINFYKYFMTAALAAVIFIITPFAYPYFNLYAQSVKRERLIKQAKMSGAAFVYAPAYYVLKGPTDNFTMNFFDAAMTERTISRYYRLEIRNSGKVSDSAVGLIGKVSPII
ncbi:MAG: DUF6056 family protein [Elusimicrobiota bacterium]|jgi:hypothetical protein|nr:DUF6056 family protein [Elusimicrobiota bacterium]